MTGRFFIGDSMSLILAAFGGLGVTFGRMGLITKKHASGGGGGGNANSVYPYLLF